jgi:uncharacterized phiE125 gp8 family phage protein
MSEWDWLNPSHNRSGNPSSHWALSLFTEPADEPITVEEAKAHLRVDFADDDDYIIGLITAARMITEERTYRALITQTWDYILDGFPPNYIIRIPKSKLQSVTSITYTDMNGTDHIFDPANYIVDKKSIPGRISLGYNKLWPVTILQPISAVSIRFIAGYGDATAVPQPLIHAMKYLISQWYEQREPVILTTRAQLMPVPLTFDFLIGPYKVVRIQ